MLKILYYLLIIYIIYNVIKFIFYAGKTSARIKKMKEQFTDNNGAEKVNNKPEKNDKTIELDHDQYKVE